MNTIVSRLGLTVAAGALMALAVVSVSSASARGRSEILQTSAQTGEPATYGDDDDDRRGGRRSDDARPYVPLEFIISQIQARTPGRLVGVRGPNGQGIYRIIWETPDGRVITFVVDGRTGQIMR